MAKKRKLIAFMGAMIDEEKNSNFIRQMESECRKDGYLLLVFGFGETREWDQDKNSCDLKLIEMAGAIDLKAIIMHLEFIKNEYLVKAIMDVGKRKNIPIIAMERYTPGCINISMRYKDGFAQIVRHVIDVHGCKKINMLAGPEGDHFSEDRIEAYKSVLEENNIPFEEKRVGYGQFWDRPARAVTRQFIESGDIPEAIVCANDNMAIACCDELERLGYKVPDDIIVTGFDGVNSALFNQPSISTVEPDYLSEVHEVMELIMEYEDKPYDDTEHGVKFLLKLRDSCGCCRSEDSLSLRDINVLSFSYSDVNWAVNSINALVSQAATLDSMSELSKVIEQTLWLWERDFQFVAVFSDLIRMEDETIPDKDYTTFFRCEYRKKSGIGVSYDEEEFIPGFDEILENSNISILIVRLLHSGNEIYGYVVEGTERTTNRDIRRCEEFGMFLSTAINAVIANRKLATLHREIEQISVIDYLTGISNRRGFFNELNNQLSQSTNQGHYITFFSIDMDGLKHINDFYGHSQGDFAIKALADAIHRFAARNGISARYGGDEFACALFTDEPIYLSPETVRSRLDNFLLKRDDVLSRDYKITASIGSSIAQINDELDLDKLMKEADEKMYSDKIERKMERKD